VGTLGQSRPGPQFIVLAVAAAAAAVITLAGRGRRADR